MILSASRRTDIPCYYSEWFFNRLKEGYVLSSNPMNRKQLRNLSLSTDEIDCIVFWTKDPLPMMDRLPIITSMGYCYYFQFTLNPYDRSLEQNLRKKKDIIATFKKLSDLLGKEKVLWRYDPIIINQDLTISYHEENFAKLCRQLRGYTDICTISFVDLYHKLNKSVKDSILTLITEEQMHQLAYHLSMIAKEYDIELRACCEQVDFTKDGIKPAACIDKKVIEHICGHAIPIKKDRNQRPCCGCLQSIDIGVYNTCKNGCVYCYANHSEASINNNLRRHDPSADILISNLYKKRDDND